MRRTVSQGRSDKQLRSEYDVRPLDKSVWIPIQPFPEGDPRRDEFKTISGEFGTIRSRGRAFALGRWCRFFDTVSGLFVEVQYFWSAGEKTELWWLRSDPERNPAITERVEVMENQTLRPRQVAAQKAQKSKKTAKKTVKKVAKINGSPVPAAEATAKKAVKKTSANGRNGKVWGEHFSTGVLRWMGLHDFSFEEATMALEGVGMGGVSPATVQTQVRAGKSGRRGAPAPLTPAQEKELLSFRSGA